MRYKYILIVFVGLFMVGGKVFSDDLIGQEGDVVAIPIDLKSMTEMDESAFNNYIAQHTFKDDAYVAWLRGTYYYQNRQFLKALEYYDQKFKVDGGLKNNLKLGTADTYVQLGVAGTKDRHESFSIAEKLYKEVIVQEPKNGIAYNQLANLYMIENKLELAVQYATRGSELHPDFLSFTVLVLSNQQLRNFKETTLAFERLYPLDPEGTVANIRVMASASVAYAEIGDIKMAKGIIFAFAEKNPESHKDPIFLKAIDYLKNIENNKENKKGQ